MAAIRYDMPMQYGTSVPYTKTEARGVRRVAEVRPYKVPGGTPYSVLYCTTPHVYDAEIYFRECSSFLRF